jgi:16S rRNA C1402 (ribose-2'-O) methylase RsmI
VGAPLADAADSWTDEKVTALLTDMMEQEGMSVKDAAAFVASRSGFKKSDVYQTALLLKNRKDT